MSEYSESSSQVEIQKNKSHNFIFHGTGGDYFGICVVNIILTIITLGLYSVWAVVRSKKFFYSHTELCGSRFEYQATGGAMFLSWLFIMIYTFAFQSSIIHQSHVLVMIFIFIAILFLPYMVTQSIRFQMQSTALNGVHFNFKASGFKSWWAILGCPLLLSVGVSLICSLIFGVSAFTSHFGATGILLMVGILVVVFVLGLGVVQGVAVSQWFNLFFNNVSFGKQKFSVVINTKKCVSICIVSMLLLMPFAVVGTFLIVPLFSEVISSTLLNGLGASALEVDANRMFSTVFEFDICLIVGLLFSMTYLYVTLRNYYYNSVCLGENISFRSTLTFSGMLCKVFINVLLTICTLGFGFPWARVNLVKYIMSCTWVDGDLDTLDLQDHNEKPETNAVSVISRAMIFNLNFL